MLALSMYTEHKMTYFERIVNVETNEVVERPYTAKEIAEVEAKKDALALEIKETEQVTAAKNALLEKLGITEDEAKLLLS
jgi:hypothetical protein